MKRWFWLIVLPLLLGLTACSNHNYLKTSRESYPVNVMQATIKGHAPRQAKISYRVGTQNSWHAVSNQQGNFVINVWGAKYQQQVTLRSRLQGQTVTKQVPVQAMESLGAYAQFAQKYNMIMRQRMLPLTMTNTITDLLHTPQQTLRASVQDQQLMGLTLIAPLQNLKKQKDLQSLVKSLMIICTLSGADGRQVLKQLQHELTKTRSQQTTFKAIHSQHRVLKMALSQKQVYFYLTAE